MHMSAMDFYTMVYTNDGKIHFFNFNGNHYLHNVVVLEAECSLLTKLRQQHEFTLAYILSGSPVPQIRPVCLIPFVCHILGTELPQYLTLVHEIVQYCRQLNITEYINLEQICVMMTEIQTIIGCQEDVSSLQGTSLKKYHFTGTQKKIWSFQSRDFSSENVGNPIQNSGHCYDLNTEH